MPPIPQPSSCLRFFLSLLTWLCAFSMTQPGSAAEKAIDFNRDIRPILSDKCYYCHGPDANKRKADLRLDDRAAAIKAGAFVPGDVKASELHDRIHQSDPDEVMPLPKSKLKLSAVDKKLLDQWIAEGAPYAQHWSFVTPGKQPAPELPQSLKNWANNGIDYFVAAKLHHANLKPSPQAKKETLIRRVTLDLTGLPPTPKEVDTFLADTSDQAYQNLVDRLLKSQQYGERMALPWLDAARFADTGGYQGDLVKTQWPWRDWVIRAYNANLPFDQFTIEQLAGDLLPNPSEDQLLATAFNRNHRINDEGGIIPEEFLVEYVADRVETTTTVWMGLTVGCARCHDHKYDPITQRDFYQLFAFFNNVPEKGKDGDIAPKPNMEVYTGGTQAEHEKIKSSVADLHKKQATYTKSNEKKITQWLTQKAASTRKLPAYTKLPDPVIHLPLDAAIKKHFQNLGSAAGKIPIKGKAKAVVANQKARHNKGVLIRLGGYLNLGKLNTNNGFDSKQAMTWSTWVNPPSTTFGIEGPVFSCLSPDDKAQGYQINLVENSASEFSIIFRLHSNRAAGKSIEVSTKQVIPRKKFAHLVVSYDGSMKASGIRIFLNGKPVELEIKKDQIGATFTTREDLLVGVETETSGPKGIRDELLHNAILDDIQVYNHQLNAPQIKTLYQLTPVQLLAARSEQSPVVRDFLSKAYFRDEDPIYQKLMTQLEKIEASLKSFESNKITKVSIMEEMEKPRDTYLLTRGAYDHPDKSAKLSPSTFASLLPMAENLPKNRLGLARWLFDPEHPLTSRVAVNRYWQMYFGRGLVKTSEDFGSQGSPPSHPDLLDWLAVEFRESDWDVKAMQKLIVMSATYRQSSVISPELLRLDPENLLLGRGPRFRLYAHALRDQALAISGKLNPRIGGPPVMPYQPAGLWEEVSAKGKKYIVAEGNALYRRSLYTFWRRTVPPPSMMNFDNASRETCSISSNRTNTPLQAMNLMNDPQYVEAARLMAERMISEGGDSASERIIFGHKLALAREPDAKVLKILTQGYNDYLKRFKSKPADAKALITIGKSVVGKNIDPAQLAAATAVASVILNLDETVTKE